MKKQYVIVRVMNEEEYYLRSPLVLNDSTVTWTSSIDDAYWYNTLKQAKQAKPYDECDVIPV